MVRREGRGSSQNLIEQGLEEIGRAAVHRVRQGGAGNCLHPQMVQPPPVGQKPLLDFPEEILSRDLGVQAGQELPPCGEALAIAVSAALRHRRIKTMSRNEVEQLGKDGIVLHDSRSCARN